MHMFNLLLGGLVIKYCSDIIAAINFARGREDDDYV